jgi:Ca2+-binding RTX toxin-like protein
MRTLFLRSFLLAFLLGSTLVAIFALQAHAGNGPETLIGTNHADRLSGGNGPDLVRGKGGNDVLGGGKGPDIVKGGSGNDRLWGGRSRDVFRCGSGWDVVHDNWSTGADVISATCEVILP